MTKFDQTDRNLEGGERNRYIYIYIYILVLRIKDNSCSASSIRKSQCDFVDRNVIELSGVPICLPKRISVVFCVLWYWCLWDFGLAAMVELGLLAGWLCLAESTTTSILRLGKTITTSILIYGKTTTTSILKFPRLLTSVRDFVFPVFFQRGVELRVPRLFLPACGTSCSPSTGVWDFVFPVYRRVGLRVPRFFFPGVWDFVFPSSFIRGVNRRRRKQKCSEQRMETLQRERFRKPFWSVALNDWIISVLGK